jgi:prepilin-type N-terminal cleavage/methylation domain-containing protein
MKIDHRLQTTGPRDHGTTDYGPRTNYASRFTCQLSPATRHPSLAFTLIEMLIVVAIMATLAALTFPILGAVKRNAIRTRAMGGVKQLETAIEAYKDKFGHYPPDNGGFFSTNQLYFELLGTTNIPVPAVHYVTLDGSAGMAASDFVTVFGPNVSGFMNCSLPGNGDEAPTGMSFFKGGLKANQFMAVIINGATNWALGTVLEGPVPFMQPGVNGQQFNPWRYNSSNPRYNSKSFDLWIDVMVGGKTNRVCNWSDQPLVVSTPY